MRTHRVATLTLTAVVGLGALVGTASTALAAPKPANGSVIAQKDPQGPVQGPQDFIPVTTTTTMKPKGPGDIAMPPHVDPPLPDPGGVIVDGDPGCNKPQCGPGDIAQPEPDPCNTPVCGPGDIAQPDPQPDPCTPLTHAPDPKDCGGTTGGTDGGTTGGGGSLPHTGVDVAMELGAALGLTGLGTVLVKASRKRKA